MNTRASNGAAIALALAAVCSSGCSKSGPAAPPGSAGGGGGGRSITVSGTVVGQDARALPGLRVLATGNAPVTSDAAGNFSFMNVAVPYDITVIDTAGKAAMVYTGLTRPDPTLTLIGTTGGGTGHMGGIHGTISGGTFTPDQGGADVTRVVFASPETIGSATASPDGTFDIPALTWFGPLVTSGSLYALQFTADADGFPVSGGYRGYGARNGIAVSDGSVLTNLLDTLRPLATGGFAGTIAAPPGYTVFAKALYARVSQAAIIGLLADPTADASFSYYTPAIPGASLLLAAEIKNAGGGVGILWTSGLPTQSLGIQINMIAAPESSLPPDGATGVDPTVPFSWMPMIGGVHLVEFRGATGNPSFYVLTSGTSATIPDLAPFGLPLPPGAVYRWVVLAFGPFPNVDGAAGYTGFTAGLTAPPPSQSGDVLVGQSATRTFTTAR
ncbi:MAG TPA: carboxypeptidase-like regulatory domain-containing protein [Bacteroidota bacterium]|nr:carboxypeptidase-like regulatory domain-containing protein [Bacteroidota bacterium]